MGMKRVLCLVLGQKAAAGMMGANKVARAQYINGLGGFYFITFVTNHLSRIS